MKITSFAKKAIAIATMTLATVSAHAINTSVDLGTITPPSLFSQVWQKSVGLFTDTWAFTIAEPTFSAGSVSNLAVSVPNFSIFNIAGLSAQLYSSSNTLIYDLDTDPGSSSNIKVGSGVFDPGSYYFKVSGNANGAFGGQYVFAVTTLPVTPVPEPESYAMLLAGLGVMGAIAVRRNKRKTD